MSLKIYNCSGWGRRHYGKDREPLPTSIKDWCEHLFLCGHNKKDMIRYVQLIKCNNRNLTEFEMRKYGSPCWGRTMDGIEPVEGVWAQQGFNSKPVLLLRAAIIEVRQDVATEVQRLLNIDKEVENAGRKWKMNNFVANFGNGIEADIKLCNGDNGTWIDSVLFNHGSEVQVLEPRNTLEGEYSFEFEDVTYVVNICGKNKMKEIWKQR